MKRTLSAATAMAAVATTTLPADPALTSWFTENSTRYARVYEDNDAQAAQEAATTWSVGQGEQDTPVYADVNEISFSEDSIYVLTSGLSSHLMGPWYFNEDDSIIFANFPSNQNRLYRIPRNPVQDLDGDLTATSAGINGLFVNGVALFDMTDTFSYDTASGFDGTTDDQNDPDGDGIADNVTVDQDAIWNRDAFTNEAVTFDPTNTHQAGSNYHYHASPLGIRHQLGDSVDYDAAANSYTENFNGQHSPILAWAADGFPVYGPYGYSDPTDSGSEVRRMISGMQFRDGTNGSTDLAATGRQTLPVWAAEFQNKNQVLAASEYGPDVDSQVNYNVYEEEFELAVLGRYLEDYAYKANLTGLTQYESATTNGEFDESIHYDLNFSNGRICVTPEYPEGIFAYFITIESDGTPAYPYILGRELYGEVTASTETEITETVTTFFSVDTFEETAQSVEADSDNINITWSAIEGGTYTIESSTTLAEGDWESIDTAATPTLNELALSEALDTREFFRITRTSLADSEDIDPANADTGGGGPGGGGPGGGGPPGGLAPQ